MMCLKKIGEKTTKDAEDIHETCFPIIDIKWMYFNKAIIIKEINLICA